MASAQVGSGEAQRHLSAASGGGAGYPLPWRRLRGLVFALPLLGLLGAGWWSLDGTRDEFAADMRRTLTLLDGHTLHTLETQEVMLAAVNTRVGRLDWAAIGGQPDVLGFLRDLVAASTTVETLGLTSPDGHIAVASETDRPPTGINLSDRDFVAAFPAGTARRRSFVAAPVFSRVDGRPLVHLSRPRLGPDGAADGGAIVAGFSPAVFERFFAAVAPSRATHLTLLRRDGTVLASYPVPVAAGARFVAAAPALADAALAALGAIPGDQPVMLPAIGDIWPEGPLLTAATRVGDWPLLLVEQGDPALIWAHWARMMAFPALGAAAASLLLAALGLRMRAAAAAERARGGAAAAAAADRAALERRLRQVEKTAALGQLAAGVAHDFNNLLQAVMSGAEALQRPAITAVEVRSLGATLLTVAERGVALTRRMLDVARRDEADSRFAAATALRVVAELLARALGERHRGRLVLPAGTLPDLRGVTAELEAVLINLVVNARDATPDGGEVVVRADLAAACPARPGAAVGPWLRVQVVDRGHGMNAATLARAGEAFFTTKPPGEGTGLGLSMARGYAERAGGVLELASTPGRGTVVTLWLPGL